MAYVNPETVLSPKNRVKSIREVVYNGGPGKWSVALLEYGKAGKLCIGFRWNGDEGERGLGHPQSRGKPTWEILPPELGDVVLEKVEQLQGSQHAKLRAGYQEMAADREREAEAEEWSEGLIGDVKN